MPASGASASSPAVPTVSAPRPVPVARSGRRGLAAGGVVAAAGVAVLVYLALFTPVFGHAPSGSTPGGNGSQGIVPVNGSLAGPGGCNAAMSPTPSAVLIPNADVNGSLVPNGQLVVSYEYAVVNYTPSDAQVQIYLPTMVAVFPTAGGAPLETVFSPAVAQPSGAGWQTPAFATRTYLSAGTVSFGGGPAVLSSQKIAVLSSLPYGGIALEFRWHWTLRDPGSSDLLGPWTVPTPNVQWPSALPSIFLPAPYVNIVSTSGSPAYIGSEFTAYVTGAVSGRSFFLELEAASNGLSIQSQNNSVPVGSNSSYPVHILLLNYDGYLFPGSYLVHIHDACGALLRSVPVTLGYAPNATITFSISPASCPGVEFNGHNYTNGARAVVAPSESPYPVVIPDCQGASFLNWTTSGGLHVESSAGILVSSNGTLTVTYPAGRPLAPSGASGPSAPPAARSGWE
jgi:hypothetical protein